MALVDLLERLERRTDTPDTPCNPDGVSAEPAPILACTLDTPDTPESSNSEDNTPEPETFPDDRRTCDQCANLEGRRCLAAWRGEIMANRDYEPVRDIPRRCEALCTESGRSRHKTGPGTLAGTDLKSGDKQ